MQSWKINHLNKIYLDNEELGEEGVKVKVSKALLDSTDINILKGEGNRYPITPSHIAIGNLSEEYEDIGMKFGEKVLISPYVTDAVATDKKVKITPEVDIMGIDVDGFMKDYVAVNSNNVYILPEGITDKDALCVENIALGIKVFSELDISKGEIVVIIGGSALSILICQLAIYYQAVPILIDSDEARLSIATDLGVYYTINPQQAEVIGQILSFTSGRMADYVVYDPNTTSPLQPAFQYAKRGGKIAVAGHKKATVSVSLTKLLEKQLQIIGINNGYDEVSAAINLLATKSIDTTFIQAKEIKFDEVDTTLAEYASLPNTNDVNIVVDVD